MKKYLTPNLLRIELNSGDILTESLDDWRVGEMKVPEDESESSHE